MDFRDMYIICFFFFFFGGSIEGILLEFMRQKNWEDHSIFIVIKHDK